MGCVYNHAKIMLLSIICRINRQRDRWFGHIAVPAKGVEHGSRDIVQDRRGEDTGAAY